MAVGRGIVAAVRQFVARFGECRSGLVLSLLRFGHGCLCGSNAGFGGLRLAPGRFRSRRRIAPAGVDQPRFRQPNLVRQRPIAFRRAGLAAQ